MLLLFKYTQTQHCCVLDCWTNWLHKSGSISYDAAWKHKQQEIISNICSHNLFGTIHFLLSDSQHTSSPSPFGSSARIWWVSFASFLQNNSSPHSIRSNSPKYRLKLDFTHKQSARRNKLFILCCYERRGPHCFLLFTLLIHLCGSCQATERRVLACAHTHTHTDRHHFIVWPPLKSVPVRIYCLLPHLLTFVIGKLHKVWYACGSHSKIDAKTQIDASKRSFAYSAYFNLAKKKSPSALSSSSVITDVLQHNQDKSLQRCFPPVLRGELIRLGFRNWHL